MNKIKLIAAAIAISLLFTTTSMAEENSQSVGLVATYSDVDSLDTSPPEAEAAIDYRQDVSEPSADAYDETVPSGLKHQVVYDGATPKAGDIILRSTVKLTTRGTITTGSTSCSGTLIARNVVLTAAHCLKGETPSVLFNNGDKFRSIHVKQAVIHPQYQEFKTGIWGLFPQPMQNDIALLFLAENADADFEPAFLPPPNIPAKGNSVTAGFGLVKENQLGNNSLPHWAKSTFQVNGDTLELSGLRPCGGDSGGPTYIKVKNQLMVIGVHSMGDTQCNNAELKGTDMNVSSYLPWIQKQLAAHRGTDI